MKKKLLITATATVIFMCAFFLGVQEDKEGEAEIAFQWAYSRINHVFEADSISFNTYLELREEIAGLDYPHEFESIDDFKGYVNWLLDCYK